MGGWWRCVEGRADWASCFFLSDPATTETSTRLPLGAPLLSSPEAPELKAATGVLAVLYLIGVTLQVLRLRGAARLSPGRVPASS